MTLATTWLGLELRNPLVASASPLNARLDNIRRLEDAGAGAVVLPSLFQEQIEAEAAAMLSFVERHAESSPEARSYFHGSASGPYGVRPDHYLDLVRRAREAVEIPVVASLNGSSPEGFAAYAGMIEQAGASALELNLFHVAADMTESGEDIEARFSETVKVVCDAIALPVSVKITPWFSAFGHFAGMLVDQGARGLVLFNRPLEQDIDLTLMRRVDAIALSEPGEMRLPMQWIAMLSGRINASLAASGGVSTSDDVVKYLLAGADVVMTTAALLRNDIDYMTKLVEGLRRWVETRRIGALSEIRGIMSWRRNESRDAFTRADYLRILERYDHVQPVPIRAV